ncbi:hypothetical protein R83H12_02324 [Fibrobacteria bacterium R8-3-H12]
MNKRTLFFAAFVLSHCACGEHSFENNNSNNSSNSSNSGCGANQQSFNPDLYECKPEINPNGIYLKQKPKDSQGNEYEAVLIGTQVWMAENLNLSVDRDGKPIGRCFEDKPENCEKYGRMYILVNDGTDIEAGGGEIECPDGWRLPGNDDSTAKDFSEDLNKLLRYVDPINYKEGSVLSGRGKNTAGKKLKAKSGWSPNYDGKDGNGTDDYGFNALPGGSCGTGCGAYEKTGEPTWSMLYPPVAGSAASPSSRASTSIFCWTSAKGQPVPLAVTWRISTEDVVDNAFQSYNNIRFYVRCLKDAP